MTLVPQLAIVTGGTRGIGRGIAHALAASGHDLILNYTRNASAAQRTREYVQERYGTRVTLVQGDVTRADTREWIFGAFAESFDETHRLAVVVHNASRPWDACENATLTPF